MIFLLKQIGLNLIRLIFIMHFTFQKERGPFPAIILLHASAGVEKVDYKWASILMRNGYIVYIIDSFSPREYKDRKSIGWYKATTAQLSDIAPAYYYLSRFSNVDSHRIGLLGFSMGGYDTLRALQMSGKGTILELKTLKFKAAAAFYGVCKLISPDAKFKTPVKIFIGEKDDRATVSACETLVNKNHLNGESFFISVYPNAQHGFDNPVLPPIKDLADEKGEEYHVGYSKEAQQAAEHDLVIFFDKYLK
jgi:dienelactone hydrolase